MSKIDKFLNYVAPTLLVAFLLGIITIFNSICILLFASPNIKNMLLQPVTEEECLEHRKDIYKRISEIAKEYGYKTQEVHVGEGIDEIKITLNDNSHINYWIYEQNSYEFVQIEYIIENGKDKYREKMDVDFLLKIANLTSILKITEADVNELLTDLKRGNKSEKDKFLIPFIFEEISCSLRYNCYNEYEYLSIISKTFNCYNLDILN